MKIQELLERRAHPNQNKKETRDEQLGQAIQKYGLDNIYATFTKINKFGINVSSKYNTPTGLYSYPIEYIDHRGIKNVPLVSTQPYIQIFRNNTPKENTWIISDKLDPLITDRLSKVLESMTGEPCPTFKNNSSLWKFIYKTVMGRKFNSHYNKDMDNFIDMTEPSKFAPVARDVMLKAGIYAIMDNGSGIIYPDEPTQALFLKLEYLTQLETIVGGNASHKDYDAMLASHDKVRKINNPDQQKKALSSLSAEEGMIYAGKIGSRVPGVENQVMKNPWYAAEYAAKYIGRWPQAEKSILTDPAASASYAIRALKKRWPEAEPIISTNKTATMRYKTAFGITGKLDK